jgi:phosphatidylserine/phosphatidylglycerophosphate/cardiolipin synthase-like enzyme
VGGINFENQREFVGKTEQAIIDFTVRFDDPELGLSLMQSVKGGRDEDATLEDVFFHGAEMASTQGANRMVEFIENTRHELVIAIAFLGQPEYVEAIVKKANEGKSIHIITSRFPTNFFRRLASYNQILRRSPQGSVRIDITDKLLHAKLMQRDRKVLWAGSKNMSLPAAATDETVAVIHGFEHDIREVISRLTGGNMTTLSLEDIENLSRKRSARFAVKFEDVISNLLIRYAKKSIQKGRVLKQKVAAMILEDKDLWA